MRNLKTVNVILAASMLAASPFLAPSTFAQDATEKSKTPSTVSITSTAIPVSATGSKRRNSAGKLSTRKKWSTKDNSAIGAQASRPSTQQNQVA